MQGAIAVAIFCKTPAAGLSKTRLSPPLQPDESAALSACFIRDISQTICDVAQDGIAKGYAVYTPRGTEDALRGLLPSGFHLHPQCEGHFGVRLATAMRELLALHAGAILVSADSPTLPVSILRDAVRAVQAGTGVVLSPALDGGYTLIGLSAMREELFVGIPWSTATVYGDTVARAEEVGLPVVNISGWYDVDDAASFQLLLAELAGRGPNFTQLRGAPASATRAHLAERIARATLEAVK
jgi:rSAM/selenodomain-associated transferase 1